MVFLTGGRKKSFLPEDEQTVQLEDEQTVSTGGSVRSCNGGYHQGQGTLPYHGSSRYEGPPGDYVWSLGMCGLDVPTFI